MQKYPERIFKTDQEFRNWLEKNWDKEKGVNVVFYKKASGKILVTPKVLMMSAMLITKLVLLL